MISEGDRPAGALIARYDGSGYTDCFVATVPGRVTQAAYVEAFYTSWLFKLERLVLALLVAKPSSDADARALAAGEGDRFAAWTVEAREPDQILMCDFMGSTRSWLMTAPDGEATTLCFGSAIVLRRGTGRPSPGFRALTPFHRLYARALLRAAIGRLKRADAGV